MGLEGSLSKVRAAASPGVTKSLREKQMELPKIQKFSSGAALFLQDGLKGWS